MVWWKLSAEERSLPSHPAGLGFFLSISNFSLKCFDVAEMYRRLILNNIMSLMVDQTNLVLVGGKLILGDGYHYYSNSLPKEIFSSSIGGVYRIGGQLGNGTILQTISHLPNLKSDWTDWKVLSNAMRSPAVILWSKLSLNLICHLFNRAVRL